MQLENERIGISQLGQTTAKRRRYKIKLNFGVGAGKVPSKWDCE